FQLVARLENGLIVVGFGHHLAVQFDRDSSRAHLEGGDQSTQPRLAIEAVWFAIECDGKRAGVSGRTHKKAASRAPWEAAFGRPSIVRPSWLPYAGMTRIRFEGFSRLRVLSAQGAPPA